MLVNRFGMNNIKNYWKDLGATSIFIDNTYFSMINAKDGSLYMKELYKFYLNNGELGKELMNSFLSVNFKLVVSDKYSVAHKYGWSGSSLHDMAIVFDDNPYILVVLSLKGNSSYKNYFNTTSNYVLDIHKSYWNERQNLCMSKFSS